MAEKTEFSSRTHFFQIDIMKTLMIILVILDHLLPHPTKRLLYIQFWLRLSVPIFLIIMGFNYGHSFKYRDHTSLRALYSRVYFDRKVRRYILPFLIFFIPLTLFVIILGQFEIRFFSSHAIFPFWGPGIWYIPVVFTAILIIPALYSLFIKRPYLTVTLAFAGELAIHLLLYYSLESTQTGTFAHDIIRFLYQSNILLYISAIALGLWFSSDWELFSTKHRFIWIALPFSLIYIILYEFAEWRPFFIMTDYNFMIVPYAAIVFLVFMKLIPEKSQGSFAKIFDRIGGSTYHILLAQAIVFSVLYNLIPSILVGDVIFTPEIYLIIGLVVISISFIIGCTWQRTERKDVSLDHTS